MPEQKKLFLLDAMALLYRSFFAMSRNPQINSKGQNTSAILGFANTLLEILKKEKPTHIAVAFDTMAPTQRHKDFADYKANRDKIPEDLVASIPYVMDLVKAMNIPVVLADGYEADDVIGTLTKQAEKKGFITYMMTPDKDFGQLVSDTTFLYKPARGGKRREVIGAKEICEKYGIENPKQFIDILGLWGDTVDNIPGVPGIGEKTAAKLISKFGSIENLLQNTDKLKGKQKENLENFAEQAIQSKQLATILLDAPVEFEEENLRLSPPDVNALKKLFEELEFRNFAKRFFSQLSEGNGNPGEATLELDFPAEEVSAANSSMKDIHNTPHQYFYIDTLEKAKVLAEKLSRQKSFCFDTETTGLDPSSAELVGMSFCFKDHEAYYIPIPETYHEAVKRVAVFKEVFENEKIEKTGQNIKFDISMLQWYDVQVKGKLFDTMIAHYLLEPDQRHKMDYLAEKYLNYKPVSIEKLIGKKGSKQGSMRTVEIDLIKEYAAEDADITWQLRKVFEPLLKETETQKLFDETEMPLVPVLASMETEGVKLDIPVLKEYSRELENDINNLEKEIWSMAGRQFNIASPKQLGEILFDKLKITDKPRKTKTGQYSTGEDILVKLSYRHPIVEKILEYRSLTKLKSTYVDSLPLLVNKRDGRIHTSYNQAVAATGRLSSNNPNLQNIPIRTERGREIRKAFIPRNEDYILLSADYSQIELRIIAHLSQDYNMMEAFRKGMDIHTATASRIYGLPPVEITKEMRRMAKTVNFGIIYGISAFGLSERLGISRREAAEIIQSYFEKYPGIDAYMKKTIAFAREHGYVETLLGRRRYIANINSANAVVRGYAERNAINAPIQGSSADMIKMAMINIFREIQKRKLKTKMILQVHDELIFDVYKEEVEEVKKLVEDKMLHALELDIPMEIDMNTGRNWLEAH